MLERKAESQGIILENLIEAHHIRPLSTLEGESDVLIDDLMMLCSNCHSMVHKGDGMDWITALKILFP